MPRATATNRAPSQTTLTGAAPSVDTPVDTRNRILRAALRLFRQHGYHGVGINDILAQAQAPKGSMYHHFPDGKEEIGAAVVGLITQSMLDLINAQPAALAPHQAVSRVGAILVDTAVRTRHEVCVLFSAFIAERASAPRLAQAVNQAYADIAAPLEKRLRAAGFGGAQARDRALLVVMLLEGGSLVAAARADVAPLKLAVAQAVQLCRLES
jgi:TetR/AcrR family transcriptional regulator, lmrAB and yxaGH operons repressor